MSVSEQLLPTKCISHTVLVMRHLEKPYRFLGALGPKESGSGPGPKGQVGGPRHPPPSKKRDETYSSNIPFPKIDENLPDSK